MWVHFFTIDKYYYVFLKCVNKDILLLWIISSHNILKYKYIMSIEPKQFSILFQHIQHFQN